MKKIDANTTVVKDDTTVLLPEYCLANIDVIARAESGPSVIVTDCFGQVVPLDLGNRTVLRTRLKHMHELRAAPGAVLNVTVREISDTERRNDEPAPPPRQLGNSLVARIRARVRAQTGGLREHFDAAPSPYELDDDDPGYMEEEMLEVASRRAEEAAAAQPPLAPIPPVDTAPGATEPGQAPGTAPTAPNNAPGS